MNICEKKRRKRSRLLFNERDEINWKWYDMKRKIWEKNPRMPGSDCLLHRHNLSKNLFLQKHERLKVKTDFFIGRKSRFEVLCRSCFSIAREIIIFIYCYRKNYVVFYIKLDKLLELIKLYFFSLQRFHMSSIEKNWKGEKLLQMAPPSI